MRLVPKTCSITNDPIQSLEADRNNTLRGVALHSLRPRILAMAMTLAAVVGDCQAATELFRQSLLEPAHVCPPLTVEGFFATEAMDALEVRNGKLARFLRSYELCSHEFRFLRPLFRLENGGWTVIPLRVVIEVMNLGAPVGCVYVEDEYRRDGTGMKYCFDNAENLKMTGS